MDIIHKINNQRHISFHDSEKIYNQAESLFLAEIGLAEWKPGHTLTFVGHYSEAAHARRLDAEHFQPKYYELFDLIQPFNLTKVLSKDKQVIETIYLEEEELYAYIEISNINVSTGEVNFTERLGKNLPPNAKLRVKGGEIIISKVRPTRGAIGIIPTLYNKKLICSSAFSIFNFDSPIREYLQVVLRSIIGKTQLERPSKGTSYPVIDDLDVRNILIPLVRPEIIKNISTLVIQSHAARQEANALLEKAKRAVEIAIEEGEDAAMKYLV